MATDDSDSKARSARIVQGGDEPPAPLTVDLPDGQKLLIGDLPSGTVIEIATWRGTGRPDSRTSRMVIGVNVGDEPTGARSTTSTPRPDSGAAIDSDSTMNSGDDEFERLPLSRKEKRQARRETRDYEKSQRVVVRRRRSSIVRWVGGTVLTIALVVGIFALTPLGMTHPTKGSTIGFGPADASLVVTRPISTLDVGMVVVAKLDGGSDTVLATVTKWQAEVVLLQTDKTSYQVNVKDLIGRVIVVVPFIGRLF